MPNSSKTPWFQYPVFDWKDKHAIVIGAGIAGCQTAWHLSQKNWKVTIIERHKKIASEASGNPAGVISPKMTATPSPGETFYTDCFHYVLDQLKALENKGMNTGWHQSGMLQLAHNKREKNRWQALKKRDFSNDFLQCLDRESAEEIAAILLNYNAVYFSKAGWIKPTQFCRALISSPNCEVKTTTEAISINKHNGQWQVFDNQQNTIAKAEVLVIANGKDLVQILPRTQRDYLPNMPVAGQTTLADATELSAKLKTVIGHEGYLTPADSKTLKHTFGATFDRNNNNPEINHEANNENAEQLSHYLPDLADTFTQNESAHAAVRMTTPDRFPYVGSLPNIDYYQKHYHDLHQGKHWKKYPQASYEKGLFILGGLGSRGLTTSGLCAKTLVDLLENKVDTDEQEQLLQYCHPARFLIKQLKTRIKKP